MPGKEFFHKKKFGQNFLIDKNIVRKIINEINPGGNDIIVEIGPGTGAITQELIGECKSLVCVEVDKTAVEILRQKFPDLIIIEKDFLKLDLNTISREDKFKIIGNIPYNITSPILFKLIENKSRISEAVLMIQLEVAKRLTARPGTKDYGILSVILNYLANVKFSFKVSPNVFYPKPKVHSAVLKLEFNKSTPIDIEDYQFISVVKASFGKRRKTLKNSLSNSIFDSYIFESDSIDFTKRAEELSVEDFIQLTKFLNAQKIK